MLRGKSDQVSRFVEVQGTAEGMAFTRGELDTLLGLAEGGLQQVFELQTEMLAVDPVRRAISR
jgi:ribonuclease PH